MLQIRGPVRFHNVRYEADARFFWSIVFTKPYVLFQTAKLSFYDATAYTYISLLHSEYFLNLKAGHRGIMPQTSRVKHQPRRDPSGTRLVTPQWDSPAQQATWV